MPITQSKRVGEPPKVPPHSITLADDELTAPSTRAQPGPVPIRIIPKVPRRARLALKLPDTDTLSLHFPPENGLTEPTARDVAIGILP
jgi:hypothetical protein